MKMLKYFLITSVTLACLKHQAVAQPYYYYTDKTARCLRYDLQNGIKELFYSYTGADTLYFGGRVTWDPTQTWIFLSGNPGEHEEAYFSLDAIKANSPSVVARRFPEQSTDSSKKTIASFTQYISNRVRDGGRVYDGIVFNPVKNQLYVTWTNDFYADFNSGKDSTGEARWYDFLNSQKTAVWDASTFMFLDTLPVPPGWITSISSVSDDGNYLYVENWGYEQAKAVGKYSLMTKQLVANRNLSSLYVPGGYTVSDSKKGNYLVVFLYPRQQMEDKKYAIYNIDKDSVCGLIPFPLSSNGFLSSNGKYVIIEETPWITMQKRWGTDYVFQHPGRISVFDGKTGQLIQKLNLPPDGKILVFDNYPNMLYYYLPAEERSININLDSIAAINSSPRLIVKLINSSGTRLTTGSLQYYEGSPNGAGWKDATNDSDGTFTINSTAKTLSLRMTYEYCTQTKSNVTVGTDTAVFQTVNAQIKLQDSNGYPIDSGTVQYYAGAWRNLGTTTNGVATKELLPNSFSFRMTYAYGSNDKAQDIGANPTVAFQTVNAVVRLQDSKGNPIDTGSVQYYAGAWRNLGTTANGGASKELLANSYSFRMTYSYASNDKTQDIGANPTVVFQTVNAAVQLQDSHGTLMPAPLGDQGTVQYYSGAWRDFGTTSNGITTRELLPNSYSFRMTYAYGSNDKQQNIGTNPSVVFQTVNATVQLKNSQGNLIDTGTVQYYAGAWRAFGTTTGGLGVKQLLPNNYSFRMTYAFVSNDKAQDISTNSTVAFSTVLCTINVTNSQSQPVNNVQASYYSGAWWQIGPTVNGQVTKELLPANLTFRVTYGTSHQDKTQNLATNNVVGFSIP